MDSLQYGGAPIGIWNGWEEKQAKRKEAAIDGKINKYMASLGDEAELVAQNAEGNFNDAECAQEPSCMMRRKRLDDTNEVREEISENTDVVDTVVTTVATEVADPLNVVPVAKGGKKASQFFGWLFGSSKGGKAVAKTGGSVLDFCCCFPAGTSVWTKNGALPIEQIKVGQLVLARDPKTGETAEKLVTALIETKPKPLYQLSVRDSAGKVTALQVTGDHPFWVKDAGWVVVSSLQTDMALTDLDEKVLHVVSAESSGITAQTYNFTVADFETYFAGDEKILVHNCKCSAAEIMAATERLGVQSLTLEGKVAKARIGTTYELRPDDIRMLKDVMRQNGATSLEVDSGLIGNDSVRAFLENRLQDGKPAFGGTVRRSYMEQSEYIIEFPL